MAILNKEKFFIVLEKMKPQKFKTVGIAVSYMNSVGLMPPLEECEMVSQTKRNYLLIGYRSKETSVVSWVLGFRTSESQPPTVKSDNLADINYKSVHYLTFANVGPLHKQVKQTKRWLADFMGYDTVDNKRLSEYGHLLRALDADFRGMSWNSDNAITLLLDTESIYAGIRRNLMRNVFDNNFSDPSRAMKLLIEGVELEYLIELWDLPDAWIQETNKPAVRFIVTDPVAKVFLNMFGVAE